MSSGAPSISLRNQLQPAGSRVTARDGANSGAVSAWQVRNVHACWLRFLLPILCDLSGKYMLTVGMSR